MLDIIMQIVGKTWADDAALAGLVHALDDILAPQENICSWGKDTPISKRTVTKLTKQARRKGAPLMAPMES